MLEDSAIENIDAEGDTSSGHILPILNKRFQPAEILPHLYLGSEYNARKLVLEELKITHVLNVKDSCRFPSYPENFLHVSLSDFGDTPLAKKFKKCFQFLDDAKFKGQKALCHCQAGINRSPTIVIGYLMKSEGWTLKKSYGHVKDKRPIISPHENYFKQLLKLEMELFGVNSMTEDEFPSLQRILRQLRSKESEKETIQSKESEKETIQSKESEEEVVQSKDVKDNDNTIDKSSLL